MLTDPAREVWSRAPLHDVVLRDGEEFAVRRVGRTFYYISGDRKVIMESLDNDTEAGMMLAVRVMRA